MKMATNGNDLLSKKCAYELYNPFSKIYWIVKDSMRLFEFRADSFSAALQTFDKHLRFFEFLEFIEFDCNDSDKQHFIKLWVEKNGLIYSGGDITIIAPPKLT